MAEVNPLFVNIGSVYGSDELGLPYRDIMWEGIADSNDLAVSQNGTPNMSVNVAEGAAWVKGDHDTARQPTYRCYNDAVKNLAIGAADPTNPRKDTIIAEVLDDIFSGVSKLWRLRVVAGTPAGSPVDPALPLSAHKLASVHVGAGVSSILNANITDRRIPAFPKGGKVRVTVAEFQRIAAAVEAFPSFGEYGGYELEVEIEEGICWRVSFNANSASAYKWEFVGGPSRAAEVAAAETTTSTTYTDLATVGPSVVVPLEGTYELVFAATLQHSASQGIASPSLGGAAVPLEDDSIVSPGTITTPSRTILRNFQANDVVKLQYRGGAAGTLTARRRTLLVRPVRVSP